jgi:hypothetical protein
MIAPVDPIPQPEQGKLGHLMKLPTGKGKLSSFFIIRLILLIKYYIFVLNDQN